MCMRENNAHKLHVHAGEQERQARASARACLACGGIPPLAAIAPGEQNNQRRVYCSPAPCRSSKPGPAAIARANKTAKDASIVRQPRACQEPAEVRSANKTEKKE